MKKLLMSLTLLGGLFFTTSCGLLGNNSLPPLENDSTGNIDRPDIEGPDQNTNEMVQIEIMYNNDQENSQLRIKKGSTLRLKDPYKKDYYFTHWTNNYGDKISMPYQVDNDLIIFANYDNRINVKLTSKFNNYSRTFVGLYNKTVELPVLQSSKATFDGWYSKENGVEIRHGDTLYCDSTEEYNLYAKWLVNDSQYEYLISDDTAIVNKKLIKDGIIDIPNEINGLPVVDVEDSLLTEKINKLVYNEVLKNEKINLTSVNELVIAEGIKEIESSKFYNAKNIKTLTLPKSLTKINSNAFDYHNLNNLEAVKYNGNISDWLNLEGFYIIKNQYNWDKFKLYFNNGVDYFEVKDVVIPEGTKIIRDNLFGNYNINTIIIPASVTKIGYSLGNINLIKYNGKPSDWIEIEKDRGLNNNSFKYLENNQYVEIKELDFRNNTEIKSGSCIGLKNMTKVYLPKNIKLIDNVFDSNTTIYYEGTFDDWIKTEHTNFAWWTTFYTKSSNGEFELLKDITLSPNITKIPNYAFYGIRNIESINLPYGVAEIGNNAFEGTNIKKIFLPASVNKIGHSAFPYTIEEINVPENMTVISSNSFGNLNNIGLFKVPHHVTTLQSYCIGAPVVYIPKSIKSIDNYAFNDDTLVLYESSKEDLRNLLNYPNNTEMKWYKNAFCNAYTSEFVKNDSCSFVNVNAKLALNLNNNTYIYGDTLYLGDLVKGYELISIKRYGLQNMNYKNIIIPKSCTTIGDSVFNNNEYNIFLETDTLPDGFSKDWLGYDEEQRNKKKVYFAKEWHYEKGVPVPYSVK